MKHILLLFLCVALAHLAHAQTVNIIDGESKEPIDMATLIAVAEHAYAITNVYGQADISDFKNLATIEIRSLGYQTRIMSYAQMEHDQYRVELERSNINLDDAVISATRWNQSSGDIPSRIAAISSRQVALQNPQTAADLLGTSGAVFIQKSQQGGGSPMIRGFATNRLLYSMDGIRINTAIFRGGNLQNVISLDPFAIENTEVLFGPGSVIYGSDAIGGVMSFQTLTPQLSLGGQPLISGKAVVRYSSANSEKTGHFDVQVGWKKWAILTSFSANDYGDLKMGSQGPDEYLRPFYVQRIDSTDVVVTNDDPRVQRPTGYTQMNLMQKVRFAPNKRWDIQYGFHYSETSDYSRYDRHIRYKNGLPRYGEWSYGPQKWMMNMLSFTHNGNNAVYDQLTLRVAQQAFEESRISRDINKPDRETRIEEIEAYSVNLDLKKDIGERNTLFCGVEWVQNDVTSTGIDEDIDAGTSQPGAARYPQATWASYGVYATDRFRVSDKLIANAGVRYSQYSIEATFDTSFYPFPFTTASLNNGALTGSLGFVYHPNPTWSISLNGATAFRSPNVDDIGKVFDSEPGAVTVPNPNLRAEYAYNADLGIAKVIGHTVKIDVTGYYTLLQNALVRRDYTLNGQDSIMYDGALSQVQAIQNAAEARVYGVQAGLEVKLPGGFGLSSRINYQVGEEELDDGTVSPARHAAPWFGVSRVMLDIQRLQLQVYAQYSGEYTFDQLPVSEQGKTEIYAIDPNGNPYSPGWYTLNFKGTYKISHDLYVSAGVENITDQRYRPYSSGIVAPGRNMIISFRCQF